MAKIIFTYEPWIKTATYCMMHFTVAITVAYLISGNWAIALSVGILEPLVQTCCYHMHERSWNRAREAYNQHSLIG